MSNLKIVYLLYATPVKLIPKVYNAKLEFRIKGSTKMISYSVIKKGLIRKDFYIKDPAFLNSSDSQFFGVPQIVKIILLLLLLFLLGEAI